MDFQKKHTISSIGVGLVKMTIFALSAGVFLKNVYFIK